MLPSVDIQILWRQKESRNKESPDDVVWQAWGRSVTHKRDNASKNIMLGDQAFLNISKSNDSLKEKVDLPTDTSYIDSSNQRARIKSSYNGEISRPTSRYEIRNLTFKSNKRLKKCSGCLYRPTDVEDILTYKKYRMKTRKKLENNKSASIEQFQQKMWRGASASKTPAKPRRDLSPLSTRPDNGVMSLPITNARPDNGITSRPITDVRPHNSVTSRSIIDVRPDNSVTSRPITDARPHNGAMLRPINDEAVVSTDKIVPRFSAGSIADIDSDLTHVNSSYDTRERASNNVDNKGDLSSRSSSKHNIKMNYSNKEKKPEYENSHSRKKRRKLESDDSSKTKHTILAKSKTEPPGGKLEPVGGWYDVRATASLEATNFQLESEEYSSSDPEGPFLLEREHLLECELWLPGTDFSSKQSTIYIPGG